MNNVAKVIDVDGKEGVEGFTYDREWISILRAYRAMKETGEDIE
jgi:hypothetical protein